MVCKNCGAELKEGQKFCHKCGTPVEEADDAKEKASGTEEADFEAEERAYEAEEKAYAESEAYAEGEAFDEEPDPIDAKEKVTEPESPGRTEPEKHKKKRHPVRMIGIVIVLIVAAVLVHSLSKTTIDLNDYTTVSFEGYDGYGKAEVYLDNNAIEEDYGSKVKIKGSEDVSLSEVLNAVIQVSLDRTEDLSNGETVTLTYEVDEDVLEEWVDCQLKYEDQEVTVSDLASTGSMDVFDGIEVTFSGVSPEGEAELSGPSLREYTYCCDFEIDPSYELSNGDTVTVYFSVSDEDAFLSEYGALPKETKKDFVVSGLDEWVTDISQLSDENVTALRKEAQEQIEAYYASYMDFWSIAKLMDLGYDTDGDHLTINVVDPDFINLYFLTKKTDKNSQNGSHDITLLCGSDVVIYDENDKEVKTGTVYFAVRFTALVKQDDGDLGGLSENTVSAYGSKDDAYSEQVSKNKSEYSVVVYDADLKKVES